MRTFVPAALFIVSMLAAGAPFAAMAPWRGPGACSANIRTYDVYQSNGVINVMDTVLMPKQIHEKAGEKKDRGNPVFLACATLITWLARLPLRRLPAWLELPSLQWPPSSPCDA